MYYSETVCRNGSWNSIQIILCIQIFVTGKNIAVTSLNKLSAVWHPGGSLSHAALPTYLHAHSYIYTQIMQSKHAVLWQG
jgi:hypothetical protein